MKLRNTSTAVPLTPMPSEPQAHPTVAPDTRAEAILFRLYTEQKEVSAEWQRKYEWALTKIQRMDDRFMKFRTRNKLRKLASEITHTSELTRRKN